MDADISIEMEYNVPVITKSQLLGTCFVPPKEGSGPIELHTGAAGLGGSDQSGAAPCRMLTCSPQLCHRASHCILIRHGRLAEQQLIIQDLSVQKHGD